MTSIFSFIAGVSFGALVVCISLCVAVISRGEETYHPKKTKFNTTDKAPDESRESYEEDMEKLKKQFENFLNYDGTEENQTDIGDE